MKLGLQILRAKIKGFQSSGEAFQRQISKNKGVKRQNLWHEKRLLGSHGREHLIAYGLLRGVPYERIEKCSKNNKPVAERVLQLMLAHCDDYQMKKNLTLTNILELIKTPELNLTEQSSQNLTKKSTNQLQTFRSSLLRAQPISKLQNHQSAIQQSPSQPLEKTERS